MWRFFRRFRKSRRRNGSTCSNPRSTERYGEDDARQNLIANNNFVAAVPVETVELSLPEATIPMPPRRKLSIVPRQRRRGRASGGKNHASSPKAHVLDAMNCRSDDPLGIRREMEEATGRKHPVEYNLSDGAASLRYVEKPSGGMNRQEQLIPRKFDSLVTKRGTESISPSPAVLPSASDQVDELLSQGMLGVGIQVRPNAKSTDDEAKPSSSNVSAKDFLADGDLEAFLKHLEAEHQVEEQERALELGNKRLAFKLCCEGRL
ncbi:MAG: hypothetical protein SGARI_006768 [Bacillariaceae sp.]